MTISTSRMIIANIGIIPIIQIQSNPCYNSHFHNCTSSIDQKTVELLFPAAAWIFFIAVRD
jgi:hypothetical protein